MIKTPALILEIGVNYYDIARQRNLDPLEAAEQMIAAAAATGAGAVKFQTYRAEKLAAAHSPAYWDLSEEPTGSQRELFARHDRLTFADYEHLAACCSRHGIEFMTTPFDLEAAENIDPLVRRHKIASADITNLHLLAKVGSFGKPVILSTGASTRPEIDAAASALQEAGAGPLTLLHCMLTYPTLPERANLWRITALQATYPELDIGYSDHTRFSPPVLLTAWLLGAKVIEKHFTLDKTLRGNDHYHAADPADITALLDTFNTHRALIGGEQKDWFDPAENQARRYARRGVYLEAGTRAGEPAAGARVAFLRPQMEGLTPFQWAVLIEGGARFARDLPAGTLVAPGDLVQPD